MHMLWAADWKPGHQPWHNQGQMSKDEKWKMQEKKEGFTLQLAAW